MTTTERQASELRAILAYNLPMLPDAAGQRVRTISAGGAVATWMETGTVVRFTRAGNPVVRVDAPDRVGGFVEVTDRWCCFRRVDEGGRWVRPDAPKPPAVPS